MAMSSTQSGNGRTRILASPLAKRLARQAGLDLASLRGSGPHGRIIKRDIEAALATPRAARAAEGRRSRPCRSAALAEVPALSDEKILALYDKGTYEVIPHDKMRRIIAERLTLAKQTIPHYYLSIDCRLDELHAGARAHECAAPREGPRAYKLSVNDFIIKAMALALQEVPAANATWTEGGMLRHKYSDVGVAVAVEGGPFHARRAPGRDQVAVGDLQRDARSRRTGAQAPARAARVSGRHDLDLQSRHVRDQELRRGDQPAARHHPGRGGGRAPPGGRAARRWSRRPS